MEVSKVDPTLHDHETPWGAIQTEAQVLLGMEPFLEAFALAVRLADQLEAPGIDPSALVVPSGTSHA